MATAAVQPWRTPRDPDVYPVAHALRLARRHRVVQLLDVAIVSVVESFRSSSTAIDCWVADGGNDVALRNKRAE